MKPIKFLTTKRLSLIIAMISVAVAGLLTNHSLKALSESESVPEKPVRMVKTMILRERNLVETRSFPGLVQAAGESKIAFRVGGPLIEFEVRVGQWVEKGQVVARIDPRDFEIKINRLTAALDEARASITAMKNGARPEDVTRLKSGLASARVQAVDAWKHYKRMKSLWVEKAVPISELDQAGTRYQAAKSQYDTMVQELNKAQRGSRREEIEAAEARIRGLESDLHAAKLALDDTCLKAPFAGYVNERYVENFETVNPGDSIVSLLDFSDVEVHTSITESLVIRRSEFDAVTCTLEAYPGRLFEATIKEVGRKTDSANQSYLLTVVLHPPQGLNISPGMAATVTIVMKDSGSDNAAVEVPRSAMFADAQGRSCVWSVDSEKSTVHRVEVETGRFSGDMVQVISGLEAGERIVTSGARFLKEGRKIRIMPGDGETDQ